MISNFFKKNHQYIVLEEFKGFSWTKDLFYKDEVLKFNVASFSPYDDCYIYNFIDNGEKSKSCWSKEIDEPTLIAHFRELDN